MYFVGVGKVSIMKLLEKFNIKIDLNLSRMLYLTNIGLFAIISFINWDISWLLNVADWNALDRTMFLIVITGVNIIAALAYKDFIKQKDKE